VDSGILTVLSNIEPIFTYTIALLFGIEKFNKNRMLMVIIGMIGIIMLVWPSSLDQINLSIWLGLSLFIPLCYAFGVVFISKFKPLGGDVLNYAMWMLFFASSLIIPISLLNGGFYPLGMNLNSGLILLEILLSTFGYILLFIIIHRAGAVLFVMVNGIAAISGLIYGKLIFSQQISYWTFFASMLIILAIMGMAILHKKVNSV
jgi:drug/metabolite transporter (DMT)-like permease